MAQWLGISTQKTDVYCYQLSAVRPRYGLMARDIRIKITTFQLSQTTIIGGRKTAKEPPLQESLPKGGQLHPLGDVAPGPPQRACHHSSQGLIAAGGFCRRGGAQRACSLPMGLGGGLDDDLLLFEQTPRRGRRAATPWRPE